MKKTMSLLIALYLIFAFSYVGTLSVVSAGTNVTTTWIVPGDTTISITYPCGESDIIFNCDGKTFTNIKATGQTGSNAAINITNDGNTALEINASWSAAWPSGVAYVNISAGDDSNSTTFSYTSGNCQTNQTLKDSLPISKGQEYWFWSDGVDVAETEGASKTLVVYARNI